MHDTLLAPLSTSIPTPPRAGYINAVRASFGHALLLMLRRQRLFLAAVITFLPVLIPLALAFLSTSAFAEKGNEIFVKLIEQLHINSLSPLLALFFASMLVGEDIEQQTVPYVLTRPLPRSAWVVGRYLAYLAVASAILICSVFMTFAACTALADLGFVRADLILLMHYAAVAMAALAGYGALALFLGVGTRRPIVYGVLLLYAWQRLAMVIPGLVDFMTIQKYTEALLPVLATQRGNIEIQTVLGAFQKEVFAVSAPRAAMMLAAISVTFLGATVFMVRWRDHSAGRAVGG